MANNNGRKNQDPAWQFYPADFWSSPKVQCMEPAEGWVYLRLLSECYRQGGLPMDMEELEIVAMSAKMAPDAFAIAWERILKRCFEEHDGRYWNPRAIRELEHRKEFKATKSEAGKMGANKRWGRKEPRSDSKQVAKDSRAKGCHDPEMANDSPQPIPTHPNPVNKQRSVVVPAAQELGAGSTELVPSKPRRKPPVNGREELAGAIHAFGDRGHCAPMDVELSDAADKYRRMRAKTRCPVWRLETWLDNFEAAVFDGAFDKAAMISALETAARSQWKSVHPKQPTQSSKTSFERTMEVMDQGIKLGLDPNY